MSKFQIILLVVFGALIILAVMTFSFARSGTVSATVTVWGEMSSSDFASFLNKSGLNHDKAITYRYSEKLPETIESEFTEALATGRGPDLIILTQDKLWKNRNKLLPIPYESISERDFRTAFVEEAELYMTPDGIYALPLLVDPLVLYYNRDHLNRAGVAKPIAFWDEMYGASGLLTIKDNAGNITKSAIALGESRNIPNSKDILSMLLLQAGTPVTRMSGGELRSVIANSFNFATPPGQAALDFYTQFANPAKPFHTWNRSLLPAQTHFISGDSSYYLGFASELKQLRAKSPTLNLAVAAVPQSRVSEKTITFGKLYGVSITRGTRNPAASLTAVLSLISKDSAAKLAETFALPPARRDLLSNKPEDSFMPVFYDSALAARGWLDPDEGATAAIFREMIESVTSGRARTSEALSKASKELEALIKQ